MKRLLSLGMLCGIFLSLWAQAPAGYYKAADGKRGASLKTALYQIINAHTVRSYKELWADMRSTDARADGRVWDMYSSVTDFNFTEDQCGNYRGEGDCYNREHSFPKSWFNDASPMYTDLFHLYPTDGYVNNRRGNYPFGETERPTYTSSGGFSRLGPSSVSGYSGTVFEPADEYKGDFARTYFYMVTCYEDRIKNWNSDMLDGKSYPGLSRWALDMLLRWAEEDPVGEKEQARNQAVYRIQGNRNPYIDFPGLEAYVWGDKTGVAFDPDHYDGETPVPLPEVAVPTFVPASGRVAAGTVVTIDCATEGAYVVFSVNHGTLRTEQPPVSLVVDEEMTIEAYAMKDDKTSESSSATYVVATGLPDEGVQTFRKVMSEEELQAGRHYLIVCESEGQAMGASDDDIRTYASVDVAGDVIRTETSREGLPFQFVLGGTPGAYTLFDVVSQTYLSLESNGNKLHASAAADSDRARWDIVFGYDETMICNKEYDDRSIQYNANSPRFACYASRQRPVALYVNTTVTSVPAPVVRETGAAVDVFAIDGRLVRKGVPAAEALKGLRPGVYVIGGKKVQVE